MRFFAIFVLACVPALAQDRSTEIEKLIEQLSAEDFSVRETATDKLVEIGDDAIPLLEKAVDSDDPETVWRAKHILERIQAGKETERTEPALPGAGRFEFQLLGPGMNGDFEKMLEKQMRELTKRLFDPNRFRKQFPDMEKLFPNGKEKNFGTFRSYRFENGRWIEEEKIGESQISTEVVSDLLRHHLRLPTDVGMALGSENPMLEEIGLRYRDIIISVDGRPVRSLDDLEPLVSSAPGTSIKVELIRDGERMEMTVLTAKPGSTVPGEPQKPEKKPDERDF